MSPRDPASAIFGTAPAEPGDPSDDLDDLASYLADWVRHLRAQRKSARTVEIYETAARRLVTFLRDNNLSTRATDVQQKQLELFMIDLGNRASKKKPDQKLSPAYVQCHVA